MEHTEKCGTKHSHQLGTAEDWYFFSFLYVQKNIDTKPLIHSELSYLSISLLDFETQIELNDVYCSKTH